MKLSSLDKYKIGGLLIVTLVVLSPAIVGYIINLKIGLTTNYALSIYGIYSVLFILIQIVCSYLNRKKIRKEVEERPDNWNELGVGLVVVGYKEEPDLLERCLESIKYSKYTNIKKIIFVIDGNDNEFLYMREIYNKVFTTDSKSLILDYLISDLSEDRIDYSIFSYCKHLCIMQPHVGKREGLYTGFKILLQDSTIDTIVTTDSDTILDEMAVTELTYASRLDNVGAVAGQIQIWNTSESLITHIISYRYWLSFNLERACQSYWGTVLCVAGPMACYKVSVLKEVLELWFNQKFLGHPCTFGDDRHLTNCILLKNAKVVFTENAIGWTDTPAHYGTYLRQQTRWAKSYFRECIFNLKSIHLHSYWMAFELEYNIIYFVLLFAWSMHILFQESIYTQAYALLLSLGISFIKCIFGIVLTKDIKFFFFYLYTFVFTLVIMPAKIAALFTLWDNKWGTRGLTRSWLYSYWSVLLWVGVLTGGFINVIYKNKDFNYERYYYYKFAFICMLTFFGFVFLTIVLEYILRKKNKISNDIEADILNNRKNSNYEYNEHQTPVHLHNIAIE